MNFIYDKLIEYIADKTNTMQRLFWQLLFSFEYSAAILTLGQKKIPAYWRGIKQELNKVTYYEKT